jgi:hypothetical protein
MSQLRVGALQSRPAWAKSKTVFQEKNQKNKKTQKTKKMSRKGWTCGLSDRTPRKSEALSLKLSTILNAPKKAKAKD